MLLEVIDLSYSREHKEILNNINFEVEASKITAVLGANGSGKSTLLSLLSGLLDRTSGEIIFQEKKVVGPAYKLVPGHQGIALVRQDARLTPYATVRENLLYVLRMYDENYQVEKIAELSSLLGITSYLERVVKFLSGGEQQRVAIAAALASEPELLLMDEPFSQTDMFLKQELKHYLFQVVQQLGVGLLFVTHSPDDALAMSDTILVLHQGQIVEKGNSEQLYYKPTNKATAYLTGYCNFLPTKKLESVRLQQIGDEYLIRPDQIVFSKTANKNSQLAVVKKIEFCGFYQGYYLYLSALATELFATKSTTTDNPKVGEEIWVDFLTLD